MVTSLRVAADGGYAHTNALQGGEEIVLRVRRAPIDPARLETREIALTAHLLLSHEQTDRARSRCKWARGIGVRGGVAHCSRDEGNRGKEPSPQRAGEENPPGLRS